jgi:hypothetical protein
MGRWVDENPPGMEMPGIPASWRGWHPPGTSATGCPVFTDFEGGVMQPESQWHPPSEKPDGIAIESGSES